jgi:predicted transcriptional regulator
MYIDILQALASKGQLRITHIMHKSNVNCQVLKSQLDFLLKNGLVEERILKREKVVYAITPRGMSILKAFSEIKQVLPIEENEVKQSPFLG